MKSFFKAIMIVFLLSLTASVFAQCIPQNGPYRDQWGYLVDPPRYHNGVCYVPAGSPSQQQQYQQQGYNQQQQYNVSSQIQQQLIGAGIQQGQRFVQNIGGQQMRCTWQDAIGTAVKDAVIANVFAYAVNRIAKRDVVDRRGATAVGALAGATIFCEPDTVNENVQPQQGYQQQVQQLQQQAQYQPQMQQQQQQNQSQQAQQYRRSQQGGAGCQNATVDGETGCYNPQYLQTLIRH